MKGLVTIKNNNLYIKYVQQHAGYTINTYEIEVHPQDKKLNLKEGQSVDFEMTYGQLPIGKNYAKIKKISA